MSKYALCHFHCHRIQLTHCNLTFKVLCIFLANALLTLNFYCCNLYQFFWFITIFNIWNDVEDVSFTVFKYDRLILTILSYLNAIPAVYWIVNIKSCKVTIIQRAASNVRQIPLSSDHIRSYIPRIRCLSVPLMWVLCCHSNIVLNLLSSSFILATRRASFTLICNFCNTGYWRSLVHFPVSHVIFFSDSHEQWSFHLSLSDSQFICWSF